MQSSVIEGAKQNSNPGQPLCLRWATFQGSRSSFRPPPRPAGGSTGCAWAFNQPVGCSSRVQLACQQPRLYLRSQSSDNSKLENAFTCRHSNTYIFFFLQLINCFRGTCCQYLIFIEWFARECGQVSVCRACLVLRIIFRIFWMACANYLVQ